MSIREEKAALRKQLRKKLRNLPKEEAAASDHAIYNTVVGFEEYQKAQTIFLYIGIDWEIDTKEIILHALAQGKKVALPLVISDGIMEARYVTGIDDLVPGAFDIPEPAADTELCDPKDIELALVPCVSCDASCMRLGQGGGFYDRFISERSFPCAALCRETGMSEKIPAEEFDMPVDYVVTENRIYSRA